VDNRPNPDDSHNRNAINSDPSLGDETVRGARPAPRGGGHLRGKLVVLALFFGGVALGLIALPFRHLMPKPATQPSTQPVVGPASMPA
jgi:hypothetical protein